MPPLPQEPPTAAGAEPRDDDIVITGMSGLFPGCHNVKEFAEKLYSGENLITKTSRWDFHHPHVSEYSGNVPNIGKFDAQFFMVHYGLANSMDGMPRKLLESSYEAVYDAGVNPSEISGRKIGVFVGSGLTEYEKVCSYSYIGFGIIGCNRSMFSNRISYCLNLKGPSMTIDASCSSSMVALELAYDAIKRGECEAALVGGSALHLHPQALYHYGRLVPSNPDGKTKSFSKDADGQSQSEVIGVLFLQKYKDAKRVYAKLCYAKSEYCRLTKQMVDQQYTPYRPLSVSTAFLNKFYHEAKISPLDVEFVEAYGAAVPDVDKAELEAIDSIFCTDRKKNLLVGSVMSNMGYSDAATGIAALVKVCLGYQRGEIAGNLHCESPRDDVKALQEGRIQVVTKNRPFQRSYVAMNNWSITGVNAHALLQGVYKPKDNTRYKTTIPHLVLISGRQDDSVRKILEDLKTRPVDPEEIALFHNIHRLRITKHMSRGFTVLSTNETNDTVSLSEKVDYHDEAKRPLWFVYSGMGSQWAGMGAQLMRIEVFAAAIQRCHKILAPKGLDLIHILTTDDPKIYDNILHSFVGIAAVQIGLTDVLTSLGVVPDKIIGHSVGELGCAYADGCLSADEMILAAYSRGLVSVQTPFIKGSMAAVGMGFKQIKALCPPEIEVACHNSAESSTISGPAEIMTEFVKSLTAKGVFAKEVPCSNIAYHSRYIKDAGPGLLKYLSEVIKSPKPRTDKWVSTSVPQDRWTEPIAQLSSAEYHTNNLLNPVLFEDAARLVPYNAVVVEVAPHGLLQAILKRSLPDSCINVALTRRGHKDSAVFFLESVGNLFIAGVDINVSALYPKVQFPVSTETRSLSHLVDWMHSENWQLPVYYKADRKVASASDFSISILDSEHQYLRGHKVDGVITYPFAGVLTCVWDTLAMSLNAPRQSLSVVFRDIHLYSLPKLDEEFPLKLTVAIHKGTGAFEVTNEKVTVAKGVIIAASPDARVIEPQAENKEILINNNDVYRVLYEKGYQYSGVFKSIKNTNISVTQAKISWNENWITFLDAIIQFAIMRQNGTQLLQPNYVRQLIIDIKRQSVDLGENLRSKGECIEACVSEQDQLIKCGGVLLENLTFVDKPLQQPQTVVLKSLEFTPFFQKDVVDISSVLYYYMQIIAENINKNMITALEISKNTKNATLYSNVQDLITGIPDLKVEYTSLDKDDFLEPTKKIKSPEVVLINNAEMNKGMSEELYHLLPNDAFLIILEETTRSNLFYKVVASAMTPRGRLVLAKWKPVPSPTQAALVTAVSSAKDLVQLLSTRQKMKPTDRLVIVTTYPPIHGLKDLVKKYRKEPQRNKIFLATVDVKTFQNMQRKQLPDFDLAFNVLSQGIWGGEFYIPIKEKSEKTREIMLRGPRDGDIGSLHWVEVPEPVQRSGVRVKVHYAGLNYYDAKKANGEFVLNEDDNTEYTYGMDYSGTTESGERVMGIVGKGSASTHVQAETALLWPVPTHWSLEDAATVPLAFAHAFYILAIKCELMPGMTLLVHGATGGLGQAVITVALAHKCRVFATVSDVKKKSFLRRMFPEIPEDHIGNSRDGTFVDMVTARTNGAGCNLVISCLKGNLTNESLKCAGHYATTVDTHVLHTKDNLNMGMFFCTHARSYMTVDFSSLFTSQNKADMKKIQLMVSEGIAKGYVRPLSRVTFGWSDACRAFRLLAASRHRGRVLLNLQGPMPPAEQRLKLSPAGTHVVLSMDADNMLTLRLVSMMLARGARTVVIHSQHRPERGDGHLQIKIRSWQKQGKRIKVFNDSLIRKDQLLEEAGKLGEVEGVLVVSTDTLDDKQESELSVLLNHLDVMTRKLTPKIQYFSVLTGSSQVSQSICSKRALEGLPATMLQLSGLETFEGNEAINNDQGIVMGWSSVLEAIERTLRSSHTITLAHGKLKPQPDIIEEVFKMPGIKTEGPINLSATMEQMGMDNEGYQKLSQILEQKFDTLISKYDVPHLTLTDLRKMQDKLKEDTSETTTGLNTFVSRVERDELLAISPIVLVPSLVQEADLRYDELYSEHPHLVMIPGIEGDHARFTSMAERLKIRTLVLQPGLSNPGETTSEMAERLTKIIIETLKPLDKFYLLGYSSGALVALEMASILESQGKVGVVFCVDAEPDTFPGALEAWLELNGTDSEEKFQDTLLEHMFKVMTGEHCDELPQKLRRKSQWADKVTKCIEGIHAIASFSKEYIREVIEAVYGRVLRARRYDSTRLRKNALASQIVLLRSRCKFATGADLASYSKVPIKIYDLKADHAKALDDISFANIVNTHLGKDILDAYESMNHCSSYLTNWDQYYKFTSEF